MFVGVKSDNLLRVRLLKIFILMYNLLNKSSMWLQKKIQVNSLLLSDSVMLFILLAWNICDS